MYVYVCGVLVLVERQAFVFACTFFHVIRISPTRSSVDWGHFIQKARDQVKARDGHSIVVGFSYFDFSTKTLIKPST